MPISVKHGAKTASLPLPPTLGALRSEVRELLDLPVGSLRLLCKGRAIEGDDDAPPGLEEGAKLMVMFSAAVAIDAAASAAPERMRGFEDSDRILRYGGVGGPAGAQARAGGASSARPSSRFGFGRTAALPAAQLASGATPGLQAAQALLTRLSTDACILALLEKREWRVGLLAEMPPQGYVGVSSSCLMGLNRNRGQSIHLRLRTDDWKGLRPYEAVVQVLLHELAHNRFDDHDDDFKALNSELGREYRAHRDAHRGARAVSDHAVAAATPQEGDDGRERVAHPGYTLGGRTLAQGGAAAEAAAEEAPRPGRMNYPLDVRAAAARAALRRATEQGCVECVECDEPQGESQ